MEEADFCLEREIQLQCAAEMQGKISSDAFLVEELLNFDEIEDEEKENAPTDSSLSPLDSSSLSSSLSNSLFPGDVGCHGFSVPIEDREELEWLSNFVEESFSGEDFQKLGGICSPPSAHGRARSKRARQVPSDWSSRLIGPESVNGPDGRKCHHCSTDKTPQWRTGPNGPKTLCNACGVRFKSGRLVPEYRPAASPTFVPAQHSNSHRKVLELRRQKVVNAAAPPGESQLATQLLPPCGSFRLSPAAANLPQVS